MQPATVPFPGFESLHLDQRVQLHDILHGDAYMPNSRSHLLPELDPTLIAHFMGDASQTKAVRAFRAALRESSTH